MSDDDSGDLNVRVESPYLSDLATGPRIPHYYGDYVRQIFMGSAAIMLVFSPFVSSEFPMALPFEIGGAIMIAILGALTNPKRQISMIANATAAGIGVIVYELLALNAFYAGQMIAFIQREALAIAFLFALYFSLKTLRNMIFHRVGRESSVGDLMKEE